MRRRSRRNPVTTFTGEQALWLWGGGLVVFSTIGYMLYQAGKSAQQIADLQAAPTASSDTTTY
jgi:hypothetical protein